MSDAPQLPAPSSETTSSGFYQILALFVIFAVIMGIVVVGSGNDTREMADREAPRVYFIAPEDGATVESPFTVVMGATGLTVEPSGEVNENAGHFHILVDTPFIPAGEIIPTDEQHFHYGNGSTEAEIVLLPGTYTLGLQFADGLHTATDYTDTITVTVLPPS